VRNHIQSSANPEPISVDVAQIEDFVVIPMGKEPRESMMESPFEKVELFWPLDLLQNGVEIIDSPGLNEHETRTKVTLEYLNQADAILFLLTSLQPCAKTEMDFIRDNLQQCGFHDVFFLFNRFDQLESKEKERVKQFGISKLKNETSFGEQGLYFISAYQALQAKQTQDIASYEQSGMKQFEQDLSTFLVSQRGKAKLMQPARLLKNYIQEALSTTIVQQRSMLNSPMKELELKYQHALPSLRLMERRLEFVRSQVDRQLLQIRKDVTKLLKDFFENMLHVLPQRILQYELENEFEVLSPKESTKRIVEELLRFVQQYIEGSFLEMQTTQLKTYLTTQVQQLFVALEETLADFYAELDDIKLTIAGQHDVDPSQKKLSPLERLGAASLQFTDIEANHQISGEHIGLSKSFFSKLAFQIATIVTAVMVGLFNPITVLPVLAGLAIFNFFAGKSGIINELKGKVAQAVISGLSEKRDESIQMSLSQLDQQFEEMKQSITQSMNAEIQSLKHQVDDIISDLKLGEATVAERNKKLDEFEQRLVRLSKEIDNFLLELAG
jgi:hypothetical protein